MTPGIRRLMPGVTPSMTGHNARNAPGIIGCMQSIRAYAPSPLRMFLLGQGLTALTQPRNQQSKIHIIYISMLWNYRGSSKAGTNIHGRVYLERVRCVPWSCRWYYDQCMTIQKSKCKNIKCCGCECDRDPTLPSDDGAESTQP